MFPNTYRSDKWKFYFSNIPGIVDSKLLKYFNSYIKSVTLPDYSVTTYQIPQPPGFSILRTPMGGVDINRNLGSIVIEFTISEDFQNYYYLWQWIYQYKSGQLSETKTSDVYKDYNSKCFSIYLLDNQQREIMEFNFYEVFCTSVSSLALGQGVSNEVSFTATFEYNEPECKLLDVMTGGDVIIPPEELDPCGVTGESVNLNVTWESN